MFAGIAAACVAVAAIAVGAAVLASSSSGKGKGPAGAAANGAEAPNSPGASQVQGLNGNASGAPGGPSSPGASTTASPKPVKSNSPTPGATGSQSSAPAASWTGWCSPTKTFGDGAVLQSCFQTDHVHFVIKGILSHLPSSRHTITINLILKDSNQQDLGQWAGSSCSPPSCVFQMTVPLALQHGSQYTVLPQRRVDGNWVTDMSDGREPGMLTY